MSVGREMVYGMCVCMCVCRHVGLCIWRSEVNVKYLPLLLAILFFEAELLTLLRAHLFSHTGTLLPAPNSSMFLHA